jgi:hypothetical protein
MADGDREVLSSLPRTRPERRSSKRGARTPAGAAKPQSNKTQARTRAKASPEATARAAPPRAVPPSGYAVPETSSPVNAGGAELIGTAIQAVGELAHLGSRALRGALARLPKA